MPRLEGLCAAGQRPCARSVRTVRTMAATCPRAPACPALHASRAAAAPRLHPHATRRTLAPPRVATPHTPAAASTTDRPANPAPPPSPSPAAPAPAMPNTHGSPQPQQQPQQPGPGQFNWVAQWYPVVVVEYMDPGRPHAFTLLGRELVLWRDGGGAWRCFEDACPHRLAPLSEGRVESDGSLMCAYHAWRFSGEGTCLSIPQAESREAEAAACGSSRSCATVYPTLQAQGLLWVWGEPGRQGMERSRGRQPATIPEMEELPASRLLPRPWYFRDLPYSADYFIENVTDPAHVGVSHHKLAGNRYAADQYFTVKELRPPSPQEGFKFAVQARTPTGTGLRARSSTTEFLPPSLVKSVVDFGGGAMLLLILYTTPTTPGHNRHIGRQVLVRGEDGRMPRGLAFFANPLMPTWLAHTLASLFLHQDQAFLHLQERNVAGRAAQQHTAKYFMPTPADNAVIAFRTWMGRMAGGGIPYAGEGSSATPTAASAASTFASAAAAPPAPLRPRSLPPGDRAKGDVFDTYHTHTEQCTVCLKALGRLRAARVAAVVGAVAGVLAAAMSTAVAASARAAAAVAGTAGNTTAAAAAAVAAPAAAAGWALLAAPPPVSAVVALALAAVCGGAVWVTNVLIGLMHRYEFTHQDNP